jgi:hypothetical protein
MFECRGCQLLRGENTSLRAQLSDQHEMLLRLIDQHAKERSELVEQLMSLTRPDALREFRRPIQPAQEVRVGPQPVRRSNFPGFQPDLRPKEPVELDE